MKSHVTKYYAMKTVLLFVVAVTLCVNKSVQCKHVSLHKLLLFLFKQTGEMTRFFPSSLAVIEGGDLIDRTAESYFYGRNFT